MKKNKKRTTVFLTEDVAPAKCFRYLAKNFREATFFLGNEIDLKEASREIKRLVKDAKILILVMSHSADAAEMEILAAENSSELTKIVLWSDSFSCYKREWFAPLRKYTNLVLTSTKSDSKGAEEMFDNAKVITSGNPLWEENHFKALSIRTNRESIRGKLGVKCDEKLIFVPMRKERNINTEHLLATLKASTLHGTIGNNVSFCITTHPNELGAENGLEEYKYIIKDNERFQIVTVSMPEMLVACDLIVNAGSGVGTEALFMNVPIVEFLPEIVLNELGKLQGGAKLWQPCINGAARSAVNKYELEYAIKKLLNPHSKESTTILKKQKEFYPAPTKPGAAVELMTTEINALLEHTTW